MKPDQAETSRFRRILDEDIHEILVRGGQALGLRVAGAALSFLFNVALARVLGADGAGLYYLALSVATLGAVFGRFGLDNALLRFTAARAAVREWGQVAGIYRQGMRLALATSLSTAVLVFVLAPALAHHLFSKPELEDPIRWMALAIAPVSLFTLHGELLKAVRRIVPAFLVQAVLLPALSLPAMLLLAPRWNVRGAVWGYGMAAVATGLTARLFWSRAVPKPARPIGSTSLRPLLAAALPLFLITIMQTVMQMISILVLGIWYSSSEVGAFGAASRTAQLTSFFLLAVNSIAAPRFASLHRQGDLQKLARVGRVSATVASLGATPVLLVFFFAPGLTMGIFGSGFEAGERALAILAVGQFVNVCTGSVGVILMMSAGERDLLKAVLVASFVQLLLSLALVPPWGISGAAVAAASGIAALNILALVLVRRRFGFLVLPTLSRHAVTG